MEDHGDGQYTACYTATISGRYRVHLTCGGDSHEVYEGLVCVPADTTPAACTAVFDAGWNDAGCIETRRAEGVAGGSAATDESRFQCR